MKVIKVYKVLYGRAGSSEQRYGPYSNYEYESELLPKRKGKRWVPGKWAKRVKGPLVLCENGYHASKLLQLPVWIEAGVLNLVERPRYVYLAELREALNQGLYPENKEVGRSIRLLRPLGRVTRKAADALYRAPAKKKAAYLRALKLLRPVK